MKIIKTFILLILFFFASKIYGQTFVPETYFGFKAGGVESTLSLNNEFYKYFKFGNSYSLSFIHIEEKSLGIQLELNYSQLGWKENLENENYFNRSLNYLQIPMLTHFNFGNKKRFIFNLGVFASYLINDKTDYSDQSLLSNHEFYEVPVSNKFNYGLSLGLGSNFQFKFGRIQLELRGNYGFLDVFTDTNIENLTGVKSIVGELSISYFYKLN